MEKDGAARPGVQFRPPDYTKFTRIIRATVDLPPANEIAYSEALTSQFGKPYNTGGILNFFRQRDWRDTSSWFCSELVAWAFEQANWPLLDPALQVYRVTPRDLLLSTKIKIVSQGNI